LVKSKSSQSSVDSPVAKDKSRVKHIERLYAKLRALPFRALGKNIGDFPLYDALLAGLASRAAQGHFVEISEIPAPDEPTISHASMLRKKGDKSPAEMAFLEYFDFLEEIRSALGQRW
jgi:hypothetical protein